MCKKYMLTDGERYNICHPEGCGLSTDPDNIGDYSWQKPENDYNILKAQIEKVLRIQGEEVKDVQEAIGRKLWYFHTGAIMSKDDKLPGEYLKHADQILSLVAPLIDKARREGIKEVVDWVKDNHGYCIATMEFMAINEPKWRVKLKEWGIE